MATNRLFSKTWLLTILLIFGSWCLIYRYKTAVPTEDEWRRGVAYLKVNRKTTHGLTWIPYWAEEGTPLFRDLNAFETPDVAAADFAQFDVVWVFTSHGADLSALPSYLSASEAWVDGPLRLWRVENRGERVVADLYTDLPKVSVSDGRRSLCDFWSGDGWHCLPEARRARTELCLKESTTARLNRFRRKRDPYCGLSRWFHVSQDVRVIGRFPRTCVWMHPKLRRPFEIDWRPAVKGETLVLRYGFTDRVISMHSKPKPRTQPARLELTLGDEQQTIEVQPKEGWFESRFSLSADQGADVIKLKATSKNPVDAHLCVSATIRKQGG